jgi:hypothetical protein
MFGRRSLSGELASVRERHAPETTAFDVDTDFETLPPATAEDLGLFVDALDPATHPIEWVPEDAPTPLHRLAGGDFTVGLPGDGTVIWTRQTVPPTVLVKARAAGTPDGFRDFLIAEALVEVGLNVPESFLPFFGDRYRALDAAIPLGPASVYQIAAALYDGWLGRRSRPIFDGWEDDLPRLHDAWVDAGDRLRGRVTDLPGAVARGETDFADATELACAAIKHGLDLPAPFGALDTAAYVDYGPEYAVRWAATTFDELVDEDDDLPPNDVDEDDDLPPNDVDGDGGDPPDAGV